MDEMAKEISDALNKDFPGAKLKHAPLPGNGKPPPTVTEVLAVLKARIDADFEAFEAGLKRLRDSL